MSSSNSLKEKLSSEKRKIAASKTNSVIRTRFDKLSSQKFPSTGSLHGKSVLIKENIAIKVEELTCASNLLQSYKSPYNATVVDRLNDASAAIIGQTNMDEFAMGSSSEQSRYGSVKNPYDLERVAGGSSGGSAAAVAEGLKRISASVELAVSENNSLRRGKLLVL